MGKINAIYQAYIKIFFQKKWLVFFSIVFPIIFFIFFSFIFTNYDDVNKIPIGLINEDQSVMSTRIINALKDNDALKVISEDPLESDKLLKNNRIEAIFIFKEGFEEAIMTTTFDQSIQLIYLDKSSIGPTLGDIIASEVITDLAIYKSANTGLIYEKRYDLNDIFDQIVYTGKAFVDKNHFEMEVDTIVRGPKSLIDEDLNIQKILKLNITFGFTLVVFTLVMFFAHSHLIDSKTSLTDRLYPAGYTYKEIFFGEYAAVYISALLIAFIQLLIFIIGLNFYGFKQIILMAITLVLLSGFSVNMILMLTLNLRNKTKYQSFITPFVFFLGLIGGAFWSTEFLSSSFKWVSYGSPFYWSLKLLNGVVLNQETHYIKIISVFLLFNIVLSIITLSSYKLHYYRIRKGNL